jgi:hypothetical protein
VCAGAQIVICAAVVLWHRDLCNVGAVTAFGLQSTASQVMRHLCQGANRCHNLRDSGSKARWGHNGLDAGPDRRSAPDSLILNLARRTPDALGLTPLFVARDGWPISLTRTLRRSLCLYCSLLHLSSAIAAVSAPSLLLPFHVQRSATSQPTTTPPTLPLPPVPPTQPPAFVAASAAFFYFPHRPSRFP